MHDHIITQSYVILFIAEHYQYLIYFLVTDNVQSFQINYNEINSNLLILLDIGCKFLRYDVLCLIILVLNLICENFTPVSFILKIKHIALVKT